MQNKAVWIQKPVIYSFVAEQLNNALVFRFPKKINIFNCFEWYNKWMNNALKDATNHLTNNKSKFMYND